MAEGARRILAGRATQLARVEGHRVVENGEDQGEASWLPFRCSGLVHYVIARREIGASSFPIPFSIWARR